MKRQSLVLLAVAFVAAGAAGCFKDPVSGLRSGPTILSLDHTSIFVAPGDSTAVTATILDNGGNVLPETDAAWSSAATTIAVVNKDTTIIPGNYLSRAFVRGVVSTGGWTTVTVQSRGLTATVRVAVVPPVLPASQVSVVGTPGPDTLVVPGTIIGHDTIPADTVAYTAGDTLVINGTSVFQFDTSQARVYLSGPSGISTGILVGKTPTQLQAAFLRPGAGKVIVTNLVLVTGNTAIGNIAIDSLIGDSTAVSRKRFGPLGVAMSPNNARLGDTITVTLPAGLALQPTSQVLVGNTGISTSDAMWELSRTANSVTGLAKRGGGGNVTVTNVSWGAVTISAFSTLNPVPIDSVASDFPVGTTQGAANVLTIPANDTAVVYGSVGPAGSAFWTFTTTAAQVLKGSLAWFGSGNPYSTGTNTVAYTEDLDFLVCNAATKCDESGVDLTGYAGATTAQPEAWTTASEPAAQYWIGILGFNAHYSIVYQMTVILQ
ncbi:MAG TPA: hypothetical protein VMF70_08580 [Gemmatimonadales bacterium]|nr:hypothetical protein [Gemmatimonadales bacterium]